MISTSMLCAGSQRTTVKCNVVFFAYVPSNSQAVPSNSQAVNRVNRSRCRCAANPCRLSCSQAVNRSRTGPASHRTYRTGFSDGFSDAEIEEGSRKTSRTSSRRSASPYSRCDCSCGHIAHLLSISVNFFFGFF